ncbi:MAG: response regulator transcription factor [Blastocatellia bacterium]|nr:response regulator transcription factor [Blastocatellia bacterium]
MSEPIKVLIVDDHTLFRKGIRKLLESMEGITIVGEAGDGQEAIRMVAQLHPNVVLMDISMRKMNGLEATIEIKKSYSNVAVVLLTMHDSEEHLKQSIEYGASGYLLKDASAQELCLAIEAANRGETYLSPAVSRKVINQFLKVRQQPELPESAETDEDNTLSTREIQILTLLVAGKSNKAIADELYLSVKTVEKHRTNLMHKLEIHHIVDLVKYAIKQGIVQV